MTLFSVLLLFLILFFRNDGQGPDYCFMRGGSEALPVTECTQDNNYKDDNTASRTTIRRRGQFI
jgi:hypothetical protein